MGGDKLGNGSEVDFLFLGSGDDNVRIRGVSSSFASEFEDWVWCFFFVLGSINRSPLASVLGPLFVKYVKSVSGWRWSFDYKFVFLWMGAPPLQMLEVKVNSN